MTSRASLGGGSPSDGRPDDRRGQIRQPVSLIVAKSEDRLSRNVRGAARERIPTLHLSPHALAKTSERLYSGAVDGPELTPLDATAQMARFFAPSNCSNVTKPGRKTISSLSCSQAKGRRSLGTTSS